MLSQRYKTANKNLEEVLLDYGFSWQPTAERCSEKLKFNYFFLEEEGRQITIAYDDVGGAWLTEGRTRLPKPFYELKRTDENGNDRDTPMRTLIGEFNGKRTEENPCPNFKQVYLYLGDQTFAWDEKGVMWQMTGRVIFGEAQLAKINAPT